MPASSPSHARAQWLLMMLNLFTVAGAAPALEFPHRLPV
jgi:hypothetical protein